MKITDEEVDKALDYLRDQASVAAAARATRLYLEDYSKALKALLMQHRPLDTLGAQERYAYAHSDYTKHLEALRDAVEQDEKYRFLIDAAKVKLEIWRSQQANERSSRIV